MLQHLSITNYAIIENLELEFEDNFAVITGETGAGKSILLGALSLILGQRTDTSVLNNKDKKCIVEGSFLIKSEQIKALFDKNDLDFEAVSLLRREINANGKSRAFINDTPVNLSILKGIASQLIDVHSQHQTLSINDYQFQIKVVDAFSNAFELLTPYENEFKLFKEKQLELTSLVNQAKTAKNDISYIQFQLEEIQNLNLKIGEQEKMEKQLELANNAEAIKRVILESTELLSNSNNNIESMLRQVTNSFSRIANSATEYEVLYNRLNSLNIELSDVAREIDLLNNNSYEEIDIEFLTTRLSTIYALNQKHRINNSDELLVCSKQLEEQLMKFNSSDGYIEQLEKEITLLESKLLKKAQTISRKRKGSFNKLTKIITTNLSELGIPEASFIIDHKVLTTIKATGIDEIEFLFSANKGFEAKPLGRVASGGELSRLMLAIKSMLTNSAGISTLIFDEIDTGVSGDIADKMGAIMKQMSKDIQVISITHLPQVAAKGDRHFKIYKETIKNKTYTRLDRLDEKDRVEEIAKMLSGKKLTDIARENAKTLLLN